MKSNNHSKSFYYIGGNYNSEKTTTSRNQLNFKKVRIIKKFILVSALSFFFQVMEITPFVMRREYIKETISQQGMMISESANAFTIKDALLFMLGFCFGLLFMLLTSPRYHF